MMDDMEMLKRCEKAWKQARNTGKKCRVYGRSVGSCGDCPVSYFRKRTLERGYGRYLFNLGYLCERAKDTEG
jgi:hypothetical protein